MSNKDVVILDEPEEKPVVLPEEPEVKVVEPGKEELLGKKFFDRFNGKAPHYKLSLSFNIHDISAEDADKCRLFDTWLKPKRLRLSVEWAEKMRAIGKLVRLELPWDE